MSLADELAKKWGKAPPVEKKTKKNKPTPKKYVVKDAEKFDDQLRDTFLSKNDNEDPEMGDLYEKSSKAKMEQEISKAETMKYKAEQERLKLMKQSGEVMEYDKGDMLFFGFIEKGSIESLRVTKKLHARIKNLCDENDPKGIMDIIDRELENIFVNIQEEQLEAVENWQKTLK